MRLSISLALTAAGLAAGILPAAAGTLLVPQQYRTIQSAVTAANPGDTVLVSPRPHRAAYNEAVTITTPGLRLQGIGNPVIDGNGLSTTVDLSYISYTTAPNGIEIQASHVTVAGFTVQNFGYGEVPIYASPAGIDVGQSATQTGFNDIVISGNTLKGNYDGLTISGYSGYPYQPTYLNGYQVSGNALTGNSNAGAETNSGALLFAGNTASNNGGNGLNVAGTGVTITGNECGSNAGSGVYVNTYDSGAPISASNPVPVTVSLNSVHDNGDSGVNVVFGTAAVTANSIARNSQYGVYLGVADYATVSNNVITGTTFPSVAANGPDYGYEDAGTGIFLDSAAGGPITVSGNVVSGSEEDGIFAYSVPAIIRGNTVTGSGEVGIHVSDDYLYSGLPGAAPGSVVVYNLAFGNVRVDARDDNYAPDGYTDLDGDYFYGDGNLAISGPDVWKHNAFGTADPAGLGK